MTDLMVSVRVWEDEDDWLDGQSAGMEGEGLTVGVRVWEDEDDWLDGQCAVCKERKNERKKQTKRKK